MTTLDGLDVLIIGAGQAGLALGYYLQETPLRFQIVDGNAQVGDSWRRRYDSLVLFTPRAYSALPGLPLAGDQDGYPGKDELADYLATYARTFNLPVTLGTTITSLARAKGRYRATTQDGTTIEARAVVLATGAFQTPLIPPMAGQLSAEVRQLTAENYKNAQQVAPGPVLVVGDGAAGRDIARELRDRHNVMLATGHARRLLPQHILGRSTWWWLDKLGILRLSGETALGRRIQKADAFPNKGNTLQDLRGQGVRVLPKLVSAQGHAVTFADGTSAVVNTVIWATGYRDNSAWVAVPEVKDAQGNFVQHQGLAPVPHFYFIGRPWQRSRGSALLCGVGADAAGLTERIVRDLRGVEPAPSGAPRPQPASARETAATR